MKCALIAPAWGFFCFALRSALQREGALGTMSNRSPDMRAMRARGNAPSAWIGEWVMDWVHARVRGEEWVQGPMPKFPTIFRKHTVLDRTGLSNVTLWSLEGKGLFPKRFALLDRVAEAQDAAE
jgi:hypothetical protein